MFCHHSNVPPFFMAGRWGRGPHAGFWQQWGEHFADPSQRPERGGVRYLVLDALVETPRHGYDIMQVLEQKSRGRYRPSPGVIYPTLQMLDELGHLQSKEVEGRRVYEITEAGRADLAANQHVVDDFYDRSGDSFEWEDHAEDVGEIFKRVGRLVKAFRRAANRGHVGPATLKAVHKILDEAIEKIEQLFQRAQ